MTITLVLAGYEGITIILVTNHVFLMADSLTMFLKNHIDYKNK